jgi:predicted nucleic acid-binding protein
MLPEGSEEVMHVSKDGLLRYILCENAAKADGEYSSGYIYLIKPVYILDPSVVSRWFIRDEVSGAALKVREDYVRGHISLIVPDCILFHLADLLQKHGGLTGMDIAAALKTMYDMHIIMPLRAQSACRAVEMAVADGLEMSKAVYLAEAELSGARLLTNDKEIASKYYAAIHISNYQ